MSTTGAGPLFIVLEGIDGAGTTTQTGRLVAHLRARGRRAEATREPSAGPIGRLVREILQGGHAARPGEAVNGRTMALLFAADRLDHLQREIEPLLAAGVDVVSDRYLLSSLAYQAEEADRAWVAELARGVRTPDLTLLLDLPIEVAARRRAAAGRPVERYDADSTLARVAGNYRTLAAARRQQPLGGASSPAALGAIRVLDGAEDVEAVERAVAAAVDEHLARGEAGR